MRRRFSYLLLVLLFATVLSAIGQEPFLTQDEWVKLRDESNGALAYENLRYLTTLHRVPATPQFDQAAEFMEKQARAYGLSEVMSEQFPIDGKITYGLMRSYLAWNVESARLAEIKSESLELRCKRDPLQCTNEGEHVIGDWANEPIRLADYSRSADVETMLVDVSNGTNDSDYAGKNVKGKIVLADGFLMGVERLAIAKYGAMGIVSDMPNQRTAWSGLDKTLVRWGHLDAREPTGFAFMVSKAEAEELRAELKQGEVKLHANVKATVGPGHWTVVSGTIPGTDANAGEIVYSCHLDHEQPGANDNGSGCVTIMESARMLAHLIAAGALAKPKRTLRFIWGPEVEGTMAYLAQHPEVRKRLRADIHMDMVGGDPFKDKAVFHVTATPWSLPSFVTDVGAAMMEAIRKGADDYASSGTGEAAAVIETRAGDAGTRNEFIADVTPYSSGSDHDDYDSSTIAVPSLYLRDWPDIYIHTDHDSLDKIDATKLRRVALIGAASGYAMAVMDEKGMFHIGAHLEAQSGKRLERDFERAMVVVNDPRMKPEEAWYEARNLMKQAVEREFEIQMSPHTGLAAVGAIRITFSGTAPFGRDHSQRDPGITAQEGYFQRRLDSAAMLRGMSTNVELTPPWIDDPAAKRIPVRIGEFGPLTYQNDDVLVARLGRERVGKIKLLSGAAVSPQMQAEDLPELYAYEIVNFVDGKRSVGEIRDAVSAEFGPIPVDVVADYLEACVEAKIIAWK